MHLVENTSDALHGRGVKKRAHARFFTPFRLQCRGGFWRCRGLTLGEFGLNHVDSII